MSARLHVVIGLLPCRSKVHKQYFFLHTCRDFQRSFSFSTCRIIMTVCTRTTVVDFIDARQLSAKIHQQEFQVVESKAPSRPRAASLPRAANRQRVTLPQERKSIPFPPSLKTRSISKLNPERNTILLMALRKYKLLLPLLGGGTDSFSYYRWHYSFEMHA